MSEELKVSGDKAQRIGPMVVAAIIAVGIVLLLMLQLGLTRYYNGQQIKSLVEGAEENGQSYTLVIHNGLTGSYSFNIE